MGSRFRRMSLADSMIVAVMQVGIVGVAMGELGVHVAV